MTKVFPATVDELNNVLLFMDEELEKAGCPLKTQTALDISMEELFVNVASYAYPEGNGTAELEVISDDSERAVILRLSDTGLKFDPLQKQDPDVTLEAEDRRIGGLGIFMVKKMMDDFSYSYEDGKNILTIKKYF